MWPKKNELSMKNGVQIAKKIHNNVRYQSKFDLQNTRGTLELCRALCTTFLTIAKRVLNTKQKELQGRILNESRPGNMNSKAGHQVILDLKITCSKTLLFLNAGHVSPELNHRCSMIKGRLNFQIRSFTGEACDITVFGI